MINANAALKRRLIIFCLLFPITGCGGDPGATESGVQSTLTAASAKPGSLNSESVKSKGVSIANASDIGAQLIIKNDCMNCHRDRQKLIGPAFSEIAQRYGDSNIDSLARTIIKGGSGKWGSLAMNPHPILSTNDAKKIVRFIFRFK